MSREPGRVRRTTSIFTDPSDPRTEAYVTVASGESLTSSPRRHPDERNRQRQVLTTPMLEVSDTVVEVEENAEVVFDLAALTASYGEKIALRNVTMKIRRNGVTAFIGPSGCGKSTLIRCLNRMNDGIATISGKVIYHGEDLYGPKIDATDVRRRIGMVFQRPNPFPKSIYDNVAFGPRIQGRRRNMDERVEKMLRHAALWDEVRDRLKAKCDRALGRSAAAAVHRPLPRCRSRGSPAGRAVLGARPDLDPRGRRPDLEPQEGLHHRDRHPQHATGGSRRRSDRVLQRRDRPRRATERDSHRVRPDNADFHQAV